MLTARVVLLVLASQVGVADPNAPPWAVILPGERR
jgi:hypothetical protein